MTNDQAKFILRAYRAGGRDAGDPAFAEALNQASSDPTLRAWFDREQRFDAAFGEKLRMVSAPMALREAILAGARASRPTSTLRRTASWVAIAASITVLLGAFLFVPTAESSDRISVDELARFALSELAGPHPRGQPMDELGVFGQWLVNTSNRMGAGLPVNLDDLRKSNCRSVKVAGREVFEICFRRGNMWYHIYMAKRKDFGCQEAEYEPMFREQGILASCTWVDNEHVYVIVSRAGLDALKEIL